MAPSLSILAPAKVNLYLRVTGRRDDGYHELATLFLKLALFDRLEIRLIDEGIDLSCPGSELAADKTNLVYRAAERFLARMGQHRLTPFGGVAITLYKEIPLAAGLGGGSSDAAAVLLALNRLFLAGLSTAELARIGVSLGADVPLFVYPWTCSWGTGIGDRLQKAHQFPPYDVLLVNPGFSVSTKWAFQNFTLTSEGNTTNLSDSANKEQGWRTNRSFLDRPITPEELYNDLEQVTLARFGELREIKARLLAGGADGALMSGSGPTIFALFARDRRQEAEQCFRMMRRNYSRSYLVRPLAPGTDLVQG